MKRVQRYPGALCIRLGYLPPRDGGRVPAERWSLTIRIRRRRVTWNLIRKESR